MKPVLLLPALLLGACAIQTNVENLGNQCPPPELGRPGWVRVCAGVGGWIGGALGGIVAIGLLPIDYPLSLLAGDHLGDATKTDVLLWPLVGGAALGHATFGGPADCVDYVFHRAWVNSPDPVTRYDFVPMQSPDLPKAQKPAEAKSATPPQQPK